MTQNIAARADQAAAALEKLANVWRIGTAVRGPSKNWHKATTENELRQATNPFGEVARERARRATSPLEGSATLTDAQANDLLAGKLYVNVHTEANKGGEIRGEVTK
jgi:hypothetical protein